MIFRNAASLFSLRVPSLFLILTNSLPPSYSFCLDCRLSLDVFGRSNKSVYVHMIARTLSNFMQFIIGAFRKIRMTYCYIYVGLNVVYVTHAYMPMYIRYLQLFRVGLPLLKKIGQQ